MNSLQYGFTELIISLIIAIGIFLLFRSILLWYWKVDTIVKNQENQTAILTQQKELLEQIYMVQGGKALKGSTDSKEEIERKAKLFDQSIK